MPQAYEVPAANVPEDERGEAFREFHAAYLSALLWAGIYGADHETGEMHHPDEYNEDDIPADERSECLADCRAFWDSHRDDFRGNEGRAGHDFYLTRNGHGAGFWDRPEVYGEGAARRLTEASKPYGDYGIPEEAMTSFEELEDAS